MPSKKRIKEIEYNVFRSELDDNSGNPISNANAGCVTLIGGIIVTILIFIMVARVLQVGKGSPAHTCAALGCSKAVKSGSNYCWLHSATYSKRRNNKKDIDSYDNRDGGSVINGGGSDKKTEAKSASSYGKIYDGMDESDSTYGSSSGSGSGSSSDSGLGSSSGSSSGSGSGSISGSSSGSTSGIGSGSSSGTSSGADTASGK